MTQLERIGRIGDLRVGDVLLGVQSSNDDNRDISHVFLVTKISRNEICCRVLSTDHADCAASNWCILAQRNINMWNRPDDFGNSRGIFKLTGER